LSVTRAHEDLVRELRLALAGLPIDRGLPDDLLVARRGDTLHAGAQRERHHPRALLRAAQPLDARELLGDRVERAGLGQQVCSRLARRLRGLLAKPFGRRARFIGRRRLRLVAVADTAEHRDELLRCRHALERVRVAERLVLRVHRLRRSDGAPQLLELVRIQVEQPVHQHRNVAQLERGLAVVQREDEVSERRAAFAERLLHELEQAHREDRSSPRTQVLQPLQRGRRGVALALAATERKHGLEVLLLAEAQRLRRALKLPHALDGGPREALGQPQRVARVTELRGGFRDVRGQLLEPVGFAGEQAHEALGRGRAAHRVAPGAVERLVGLRVGADDQLAHEAQLLGRVAAELIDERGDLRSGDAGLAILQPLERFLQRRRKLRVEDRTAAGLGDAHERRKSYYDSGGFPIRGASQEMRNALFQGWASCSTRPACCAAAA
jgi:hypothetical protein